MALKMNADDATRPIVEISFMISKCFFLIVQQKDKMRRDLSSNAIMSITIFLDGTE